VLVRVYMDESEVARVGFIPLRNVEKTV